MNHWLKKIGFLTENKTSLYNQFNLKELAGGMGDLGTLLPLLFALIIVNGFSASILFFSFGIIYILSGWFYKVPVSVQPLKAMSVLAISYGFSTEFLASTSFFYGILFIILSLTGIIKWLQSFFSDAMVRGVQIGIGLILIEKSIELTLNKGIILSLPNEHIFLKVILLLAFIIFIWWLQFIRKIPLNFFLILVFVPIMAFLFKSNLQFPENALQLSIHVPSFSVLKNAIILLIIPQLPLTMGNAIYAASDACHQFWGKQAQRVNTTRLSFSIGLSDTLIGLLGGFPICHGAGGIGAHAQFGAKSGGATILMGSILILLALITPLQSFIFLIPIPLLAAMLIFDSLRMILTFRTLENWFSILIATLIGTISFLTRNLTIAIAIGWIIEKAYQFIITKIKFAEE